jgi:hypothetical protein
VLLPEIVDGAWFTITNAVALHPLLIIYDMVVEPIDTPVTTPVVLPTLAIDEFAEIQEPPVVVLVSVVVLPIHTLVLPPMAAGVALTVTTCLVKQPLLSV